MSSLADIMNTSGARNRRRGSGTTTPTQQQPTQTPQPQQTGTTPTVQPAQGEVSAPQTAAQPTAAQPTAPQPTAPQPTPHGQGSQVANITPASSERSYNNPQKELPPTDEELQQQEEAENPHRMSLEEIANHLYATSKPSPEEEERQRKRERSRAILSAIGDGVSALSNLYHTSKYAPDMSTPDSSLSGKAKERYDRFVQVRKENEARYNNAILRARQGDYEMNMKEREIARKEAADAAKDAREAKRYEEQAKAKAEELRIKAEQAQTAKERAEYEKQYNDALLDLKQKALEADIAAKKEQAAVRRATLAETARHNRTVEGLSRERNNISRSKGGGKNSGGVDASDMYYISGRNFTIGRKKQLSKMEQDAIYQYAVNMGWVDKKNQSAVNSGSLKKGDIIAKLANYTPQAKQYLIDNYGYTEINNGKSLGLKHNKGKKILGLK